MKYKIIIFVCLAVMTSCSPRVIENVVERHDTAYIERIRYDSIRLHDSIFVSQFLKGDTVYITQEKWHTAYRDRIIRDTSYISQRDTLKVTEIREVEKKLSTWQNMFIGLGRITLIGLLILGGWKLRKFL